ncbi:hypothetical protein GE061_004837 [Apolygus lucorum]|uniref:Uncharacterized protein n=1 Tax=Apolygus lucorum TaxID=248454 RepID=A0A8S9X249_APOLU|nr:hypothetical protein GE061_004837 [Apolygus lucorum]
MHVNESLDIRQEYGEQSSYYIMKNFTKEELETIKDFLTVDRKPIDPADFASKFECGESACSLCASLKIQGQTREVCVKEYNRKHKPSGLTALYVDGKQVHEFVVFNKYCQRLWGKVSGCLAVYDRAPAVGRSCYKMDINLLYTLVTFDFNCVKHAGENIKLDTSKPHKAGQGILDIDLFGGKQPVVTVNQKDNETVKLVSEAAQELLNDL